MTTKKTYHKPIPPRHTETPAHIEWKKRQAEQVGDKTILTETVIQEAVRVINGPRRKAYGSAKESFGAVAEAWTAYLRMASDNPAMKPLTGADVCQLMIILKAMRHAVGHGRDDLVDQIGYSALSAIVEGLDKETN